MEVTESITKRRGRPPGSKNKPSKASNKAEKQTEKKVAESAAETSAAEVLPTEPTPALKFREGKAPKGVKPVKSSGFNILERGPGIRAALQESLARGEKSARLIVSDPNKPRLLIPVLPFQMQLALQAKGLHSGTLMNIYGPESVGKTTLKFTIMGWGIRHNTPVADFGSEAKPMLEERVQQCLHYDKSVARLMYDSIYRRELHDIVNFVDESEEWLMSIRDPRRPETFVPLHIPAIIGIDSWGQLMDEGEAGSFAAYGGPNLITAKKAGKPGKEKSDKTKAREAVQAKKDAAKIKDIGSGGTFGSAKLAAALCRRLPHILSTHNAFVINIRPQTDKIDMNVRPGGSFIAEEDKAKNNNQSRGGKSFPKLASYELILGAGRRIKRVIAGEDVVTGQDINVNVYKNSFGPRFRTFSYRINMAGYRDTDQFQDMALDFSSTLPDTLKSIRLDVVRYSDNDFSCTSLGVDRGTCAEMEAAFYRRGDIVNALGKQLKITGYEEGLVFLPALNPAFMPAETTITDPASVDTQSIIEDAFIEEKMADTDAETQGGGNLLGKE